MGVLADVCLAAGADAGDSEQGLALGLGDTISFLGAERRSGSFFLSTAITYRESPGESSISDGAVRSSVPSLPVAVATSPFPRIPVSPMHLWPSAHGSRLSFPFPRFSPAPPLLCISAHGSPDLRRPSAHETPTRLPGA